MAEVKVDEVLRLCKNHVSIGSTPPPRKYCIVSALTVGDEAAKVAADNAVPGRALALVKLDSAVSRQYTFLRRTTRSVCRLYVDRHRGCTNSALNVLCNILVKGQQLCVQVAAQTTYPLNGKLGHGLLSCIPSPLVPASSLP